MLQSTQHLKSEKASPDECPPPAKRAKIDFTQQVIFEVGPAKKEFFVHQSLLPEATTLRANRLLTSHITLQETSPRAFEVYANWLYNKDLVLPHAGVGLYDDPWCCLFECYRIGVVLNDLKFRNATTDCALSINEHIEGNGTEDHEVIRSYPSHAMIIFIWPLVRANSKIVQLAADLCLYRRNSDDFVEHIRDYHKDFVYCLAAAGARIAQGGICLPPEQRDRCFYHEHKDESDKCM